MDVETFLLKNKIENIKASFIEEGWIKIYEFQNNNDIHNQNFIFPCIVTQKIIKSYRENADWIIRPGGEGKPTVFETYKNGKSSSVYKTYSDEGIEPFLFSKHFSYNGGDESYIDISEEFILYFKLYEKGDSKQARKFFYIDDSGDLEEIIVIDKEGVRVKLKYLKEYLNVRKVTLSICFDFMRLGELNAKLNGIVYANKDFNGKNYFYNHVIAPVGYIENANNQSWIRGKVLIDFDNKNRSTHFDIDNYKYEEFITSYDKEGNVILEDCKNDSNKMFQLTFFKKQVLDKYYNEPNKYQVDGFQVKSKFFTLKIDNNLEDCVPVFLTELGRLPHKEQLHWKQYNIAPQKRISRVFHKTMIEGNWAEEPEAIDLLFKHKYIEFNREWEKKFGWKFYKSLSGLDKHLFTALHLPTSNNVKSFGEQIQTIVKLTIDRLNEAEISKGLVLEENDRGIVKLEKFIKSKHIEIPDLIIFLKQLYALRSGLLSHTFSESNKKCKEAIKYFRLNEHNYVEVAKDIFVKSIATLKTFEDQFLSNKE